MATSRMKMLIFKKLLHVILFAFAVFLFVLHVRKIFATFSKGRTNFSTQTDHFEELQLPAVTLCSSQVYDWDILKSYNLSSGFLTINENNSIGNKTVYDIFDEVSMVLNKDFSLYIRPPDSVFSTSGMGALLVEGRNVFTNTIQGEYYVDVYKMYTMWDGICYTIASHNYQKQDDYSLITLVLNESISESKIPTSMSGVISTRDERYGSVLGTWPGTSQFSFTSHFGAMTMLMIEKHLTHRYWDSTSSNELRKCTNYTNAAYSSCLGKIIITELVNASQVCERPCKVATMLNLYELLPNNTTPKCLTVKDHNCMIKHSYITALVNHPCKPACSSAQYTGSGKEREGYSAKNELILGIVFISTSVTVNEEYLIYDIYSFVGSVGGYMGLFIGFSFFSFGVMIVNYLIGKCFNGVQDDIF
jgi:hypothetical protein